MKARVARFYGFSDGEIDSFSYSKFLDYAKCIEMIKASEDLNDLNVVSYPHMSKKQDRQRIIKGLRKQAQKYMPVKPATMDSIRRALGLGNG